MDEGTPIAVDNLAPIYKGPTATVATAEKPYVHIEVGREEEEGRECAVIASSNQEAAKRHQQLIRHTATAAK